MSGVASSPNVVSSVRPIHPSRGPSPAENAGEASPFAMLLESNNAEPSAPAQPDRVAPPKASRSESKPEDKPTESAPNSAEAGDDTKPSECTKPAEGDETGKVAKDSETPKTETDGDADGTDSDVKVDASVIVSTPTDGAKTQTTPVIAASVVVPTVAAAEAPASDAVSEIKAAGCEKSSNEPSITTPTATVASPDATPTQTQIDLTQSATDAESADAAAAVPQTETSDAAESAKSATVTTPKVTAETAQTPAMADVQTAPEAPTVAADAASEEQPVPGTTPAPAAPGKKTVAAFKSETFQTSSKTPTAGIPADGETDQSTSADTPVMVDAPAPKSTKETAKLLSAETETPAAANKTQAATLTQTSSPKIDTAAVAANAPVVARDPAVKDTEAKTEIEAATTHRLDPALKSEPLAEVTRALDSANLKTSVDASQPGNPTLPAPQTVTTPTQFLATPVAASTTASAAIPLAALPVEIAAQAKDGKNRFEIRLDPPELGRIDVRLDIDRNGHVTSRLMVERPETLDLLRRDAHQIERALQDAGLKTSDQGLQFSLRDQSFAEQSDDALPTTGRIVVQDDIVPAPIINNYGRLLGLGSGIDIRV